jgi:hypothetical protein
MESSDACNEAMESSDACNEAMEALMPAEKPWKL